MAALDDMLQALRARCGFEPAEMSTKGQFRALARVTQPANWAIVRRLIHDASTEGVSWTYDISQLYFLKVKVKGAQEVKGWRLILSSKDLEATYTEIAQLITKAPAAKVSVDEVLLPGGGYHRVPGKNGGGVSFTGEGGGKPAFEFFVGRR